MTGFTVRSWTPERVGPSRSTPGASSKPRGRHGVCAEVKAIGSTPPVALKVIGTFQMKLRIMQRFDVWLQTSVWSESRRSIFSPASAALASGTVMLNFVAGDLTF